MVTDGSGDLEGGDVSGTENMKPLLSRTIRPSRRIECGSMAAPLCQCLQKRQSLKKYQLMSGAVRNPPTSVMTEKPI
jgi:hypothetical protein